MAKRAHQGGLPVRWERETIVLVVPPPHDPGLDHEQLVTLTQRAADVWKDGRLGISIVAEPAFQAAPPGKDGTSTLNLLTSRWCPPGKTGDAECYGSAQVANTTLESLPWPDRQERKLLEADIVINGVERVWRLPHHQSELSAVLVHEIGHLLGLDHPCAGSASGTDACAPYVAAAMHPMPLREGTGPILKPTTDEVQLLRELYSGPASSNTALIWGAAFIFTLTLLTVASIRRKHGA